jgi:hypothetical protein
MLTFEEWWSELRSYAIQRGCLEILGNDPEIYREENYRYYLEQGTTIEEELEEQIYAWQVMH